MIETIWIMQILVNMAAAACFWYILKWERAQNQYNDLTDQQIDKVQELGEVSRKSLEISIDNMRMTQNAQNNINKEFIDKQEVQGEGLDNAWKDIALIKAEQKKLQKTVKELVRKS